ncbi:Mn2+/Fe2+ transporter, NRAMP family [Alicyclobacillus hesperidum URH17-3-68]|uniref:SgcJ/EcaC family oxidoreductase n=1 Tax=Alicyclobacillus hesperidum TaxID=89784 RepID=UPI000281B322|nr:SgcJ/EcaC family oxidoreductase [Alicyclobacillus hesperidum]EJY55703.1 Mn2+/Fe2+ transporter, NRAMP family [Alicyclobacillus hesperidum URH17-3-68]
MDSRKQQVITLYQQLLDAWNHQDARSMADLYTEDGEQVGFDGSQVIGQAEIYAHIAPIFEHHATARFVSKVKSVRFLSDDVAVLRAIAGMVPCGQSNINPNVNTHHTLIAIWTGGKWRIVLFQNTPAQFHGTPELAEQMSAELRALL